MLAPPELAKIHPLGKSPVISVTGPGKDAKPIILAESGVMTEYLVDHFPEGAKLVPTKWEEGLEGQIGGETEAWMRYKYYLHYAEGSLMPNLVIGIVVSRKFCCFKKLLFKSACYVTNAVYRTQITTGSLPRPSHY